MDEDDNGKFRLERVLTDTTQACIYTRFDRLVINVRHKYTELFNIHFRSLEGVSHYRDAQLQVTETYAYFAFCEI